MLDLHASQSPPLDVPSGGSAAVRADIARLSGLLAESLLRQEGPGLLQLVERVRALTTQVPDSPGEADELKRVLAEVDLQTGIRLVRAFSAYFRLADVAQQVHLVDSLAVRRMQDRSGLEQTIDRIAAEGVPRELLEPMIRP